MSSSSWTVKICFKPTVDKEFIKELKIDSKLSVFHLRLMACTLFSVNEPQCFHLLNKKLAVNSTSSIKDSGLIQGSTVTLVKRGFSQLPSAHVTLNVRITSPQGPLKVLAQYSTNDLIIPSLKRVHVNGNSILAHPLSCLPELQLNGSIFTAQDLQEMSDFTFESLDIKGNTSISITMTRAASDEAVLQFDNFINQIEAASVNTSALKEPTAQKPASVSNNNTPQKDESMLLPTTKSEVYSSPPFRILKISKKTEILPDLPDSFFQLTGAEIKAFHNSYTSLTKSLVDRPFVSAKFASPKVSLIKEFIEMKFVFENEDINVLAKFKNNTIGKNTFYELFTETAFELGQELYEFLQGNILEHSKGLELWYGPPHQLIKNDQRQLLEIGISGPSRILVKADQLAFRNDLQIEEQ